MLTLNKLGLTTVYRVLFYSCRDTRYWQSLGVGEILLTITFHLYIIQLQITPQNVRTGQLFTMICTICKLEGN
jgi:hypothetical protein